MSQRSSESVNDLIEDYMAQVHSALKGRSQAEQRDIEQEIRRHIDESMAMLGPDASSVEVAEVLERLGTPEEFIESGPSQMQEFATDRLAVGALVAAGLALALTWSFLPSAGLPVGIVVAYLAVREQLPWQRLLIAAGSLCVLSTLFVWLVVGAGFFGAVFRGSGSSHT